MSKRKSFKHRVWRTAGTIILLLALFVPFYVYHTNTAVAPETRTVTVDIPQGTGFFGATDILDRAGLIKNRPLYYVLVIGKQAHRQIRAGEYEFTTAMTPRQIVKKLVKGEIKHHRVTIPEDLTLREIAERLAEHKLADPEQFIALAHDRKFLASLDIDAASAEGYLFPDTYLLDRTMSQREIMRLMVREFRKRVTPDMIVRAEALGMTMGEWVTLASLIGKESGCRSEKPLISAVFHNRLKKGMKLQSDPTAVYDLAHFNGTITRRHLRRRVPHNTYWIAGLPPGPIANPGLDSLKAALEPAPVDYLYFVSNNNGSHYFSSTLLAHRQAIVKYQTDRKKN
ncbi:MAG: endolytic transglycosylase MltG [Syntrophales bacterium]|jgi:UPF0755 protein|nr:endolytic transglycosylase MltG [Syntrophales bacterium]MDD4338052.1 endolytic transglycosylase MltG [Syntrophales bacterium]HOG07456.1 endolytic transglycosylase MltG [Syntrophales bacterium]HOS77718.1 endolytic transglycosylase MltG [Syntrophales bacterium]HPB70007.1 endolytic transglycosylase MltG [Syntrophales bacterium]